MEENMRNEGERQQDARSSDQDRGGETAAGPTLPAQALRERPTLAEVIARAASGDREAVRILIGLYHGRLMRRALRECRGDPDAARDLVHDSIVKSITNLTSLRKPDGFAARAEQFIHDLARKCRKERKRQVNLDQALSSPQFLAATILEPSQASSLDFQSLRTALQAPPVNCSKRLRATSAFMLQFFDEHGVFPSVAVIARQLGIGHGHAQKWRGRIIESWRKISRKLGFSGREHSTDEKKLRTTEKK
jgi:DNA-directed RNA polymerase specialized sigma24 family protein